MRLKDFKTRSKKGISQTDLYQMLSYAYKRGCSEVLLIYPNIGEDLNEPDYFKINSGFAEQHNISVKAIEIPFWSINDFSNLELKLKSSLTGVLIN